MAGHAHKHEPVSCASEAHVEQPQRLGAGARRLLLRGITLSEFIEQRHTRIEAARFARSPAS